MKRFLSLLFAVGVTVLLLSCTNEKSTEKRALKELGDTLLGDYTAEVSFTLSSPLDEEPLCGRALVEKSNGDLRLLLHEPATLDGMSIEADRTGEPESISFSYYGLRYPLPANGMKKLTLFLDCFSGGLSSAIAYVGNDAVIVCDELTPDGVPYRAFDIPFAEEMFTVVFDPESGALHRLCGKSGDFSAEIIIEDFSKTGIS